MTYRISMMLNDWSFWRWINLNWRWPAAVGASRSDLLHHPGLKAKHLFSASAGMMLRTTAALS